MEKLLHKLARQLDNLDEASLMQLWSKYATATSRFEPTQRWEDACLVFALIQAKRWKNQLFNYSWSQQRMPPLKDSGEDAPKPVIDFNLEEKTMTSGADLRRSPCRVLAFRPAEADQQNNS